ncbi:KR domain-containing protein [Xylariales sp. AK1849]|nr:KR domain-containing protein [Xylariales sp. AK1849]
MAVREHNWGKLLPCVRPKLQASWNLHNLLPKDMNSVVLLSSLANVVGNGDQANYHVGNSFQDAFARYRVLNGLKAVALDLAVILSVGYVAETDSDLVNHLRELGAESIREEGFHAILDESCNHSLPPQLDADVAVFDMMELSSLRALASLIATRSSFVTHEEQKE